MIGHNLFNCIDFLHRTLTWWLMLREDKKYMHRSLSPVHKISTFSQCDVRDSTYSNSNFKSVIIIFQSYREPLIFLTAIWPMTGECLSILNNYNQPFYGCPMLLHSIFGPTTITTTNQRMRTPRETDFPIVRVPASAFGLTLCSPVYPLLLMFWAFRTINILPNNTDILFGGAIYLAKWSPTLRVLSILPNQTVRNWWNYREKMQRHRSIEKKVRIESKRSICVLTRILITAWQ